MIVDKPGIYPGISSEDYHSDRFTTERTLSSTGARKLITECPAAFRYAEPEHKIEFDIGNATHLLVLQPEEFERAIWRLSFDDYKKKDAKAERDEARGRGRIPLLPKDVDLVRAMRQAVFDHPFAGAAFRDGVPETSIYWRDPEFGVMCRTRPDWMPNHRRYLVDLKTAMSANPVAFEKAIHQHGYAQQAAWYLDGVEAVSGHRPERFAFIVVSKTRPHLVTVCWLRAEAIEWGRILNRKARSIFAWCMRNNAWPQYQPDITGPAAAFEVGYPVWAERELQRRFEAGEFEPIPVMEDANV